MSKEDISINVQPTNDQTGEGLGDAQYVQDMVNLVDGNKDTIDLIKQKQQGDGDVKEGEEQQALLAGKYKSEEELQKGILELLKKDRGGGEDVSLEDIYKSLESSVLGGGNKQQQQQEEDEDDNQQKELKGIDKKDNTDKNKNNNKEQLDIQEFVNEYTEKGELSKKSFEKLNELGLSEEFVTAYIQGQEAIAERVKTEVYSVCGGEEQYMEMINWAVDNLKESETQMFNTAITQGADQAKFAVEALHARYSKAVGKSPSKLIQGNLGAGRGPGDAFESINQLTVAMSDPRYESDPAYRKNIQDRLSRSSIL